MGHIFQENFPETVRVRNFTIFLANLHAFEVCNYPLRHLGNVYSRVVKGYR